MEKSKFEIKKTCTDCRFSDRHVTEVGNVTICRYNPPLAAYAFMPGTRPGEGTMLAQSIYPEMRNGDWCGKLEPRHKELDS